MTRYRLANLAKLDFFDAFDYIAEDSFQAALRWEQKVLDAYDHIADWPLSGRLKPDLIPAPFRLWFVDPYVILYDPSSDPLHILALIHGSRDLATILPTRIPEIQ